MRETASNTYGWKLLGQWFKKKNKKSTITKAYATWPQEKAKVVFITHRLLLKKSF